MKAFNRRSPFTVFVLEIPQFGGIMMNNDEMTLILLYEH